MSTFGMFARVARLPAIGLWVVVAALGTAVAFHWLREAAATPPPQPAAVPRPAVDLDAAVAQAAAIPLFGEAPARGPATGSDTAPLDIRLKGVVAGNGGTVAAIVNTGGEEDELALPGAELRPGVMLESVHPTHILVGRTGLSQRVELEPVRSEASRSQGTGRRGRRAAHDAPPATAAIEPEAPAAGVEPSAEQPLAPPMPQSRAAPESPAPAA
jgi:type II secretory pathway component PulC